MNQLLIEVLEKRLKGFKLLFVSITTGATETFFIFEKYFYSFNFVHNSYIIFPQMIYQEDINTLTNSFVAHEQ